MNLEKEQVKEFDFSYRFDVIDKRLSSIDDINNKIQTINNSIIEIQTSQISNSKLLAKLEQRQLDEETNNKDKMFSLVNRLIIAILTITGFLLGIKLL